MSNMKINIDAPIKQKEIMACLEALDSPKYTYLGHPKNMITQIQFEVSNYEEGKDIVAFTKGFLKSQPFGKAIVFRVLEDGKNW